MSGRKIVAGLEEATAHARGESTRVRVRHVSAERSIDVRALRTRLSLTQQEFAEQFGFSLSAVRHWEQGSREPERAARILLALIERDPHYVRETVERTARAPHYA